MTIRSASYKLLIVFWNKSKHLLIKASELTRWQMIKVRTSEYVWQPEMGQVTRSRPLLTGNKRGKKFGSIKYRKLNISAIKEYFSQNKNHFDNFLLVLPLVKFRRKKTHALNIFHKQSRQVVHEIGTKYVSNWQQNILYTKSQKTLCRKKVPTSKT